MNKLKEQLRLRMLGQLSDEKTEVDINNAYSVAVDFCLSFTSFLRENYSTGNKYGDIFVENTLWRKFNTNEQCTTEELLDKFLNDW